MRSLTANVTDVGTGWKLIKSLGAHEPQFQFLRVVAPFFNDACIVAPFFNDDRLETQDFGKYLIAYVIKKTGSTLSNNEVMKFVAKQATTPFKENIIISLVTRT